MTSHLVWATGVLGDFLVLLALLSTRRVRWLPWFTLLIAVHFMATVGLKTAAHLSAHEIVGLPALLVDCVDVLLQSAVVAELMWIALRPLARIWRFTLPLLLLAWCGLILMSAARGGNHTLRADLALMHFFLSLLMVEWAGLLGLLRRRLRLSWLSPVFAISFGYGVFAVLELASRHHSASGGLSATLANPFVRLSVYVVVLTWWLASLLGKEPTVLRLEV